MRIVSAKSVTLGAIIGLLGVALLATPLGFELEEEAGLALLFKLRGPRPAPDDVIVISIDKLSADKLCAAGRFADKLCTEGKWWPRSLHADLVDQLARADARVIVFDLTFDTPRDNDDALLSAAIARAGRVAVVEFLKREEYSLGNAKASKEKSMPPIEQIKNAALATAPFPLPKLPVRVNAYAPFAHNAGDMATLPVVAFQIYALQAYGKLYDVCRVAIGAHVPRPPADAADPNAAFDELMNRLRKVMTSEPESALALRQCTQSVGTADVSAKRVLDALLGVYAHQGMRHFDLYGPPRSITTIGYADALTLMADARGRERFSGKSVFIGVSEVLQPEQKDKYYTVFSRTDGVDINGVELAATAFANLLENRTVHWEYGVALGLVLAWGLAAGMIARRLATPRAALVIIGLALIYVAAVHLQFADSGLWLPVIVPLLLQAPAAFALGALGQYRELSREKNNIRRAFGHFLPDAVVAELARDVSRIPTHSQLVSGTCLATDISGYTDIAEKLDPGELRLIMNAYYEQVFRPVTAHRGIISDVVGDAMVAIWAAATDSASLRAQACRAALEIAAAAEAFGRTAGHPALPTRIGLESGRMALGNVGGMSHYEYRAVGDIVNTASRIQDLNKLLGTKVLMSSGVFEGVDGILGRHLGEFRLRGKSKPVSVYELTGAEPDITDEQRWLCHSFAEALGALRAQRWEEAQGILLRLLERFPDDGPARFYLQLLEREHGAAQRWDGVVAVNTE